MNEDEKNDAVARIERRDGAETMLEVTAAFASAAPWVGGAISNYMTGKANDRKFRRVADELKALAEEMRRVESDTAKEYVKTEEFEDLLDLTMQKIATERSDAKRGMYRAFLANTAASPGEPWSEKQKFLRTIEEVEPDHVRLLKALMQEPRRDLPPMAFGSAGQTIRSRAPEIAGRVEDLARELDRMGLTSVGQLGGMMTRTWNGRFARTSDAIWPAIPALCYGRIARRVRLTFFRSAASGLHVPARLALELAKHEARKRRASVGRSSAAAKSWAAINCERVQGLVV